jgi:hypothetical protein
MNRAWLAVSVLSVLLTMGIPADGQEASEPFDRNRERGTIELQTGAGWGLASGLVPRGGKQFDLGFAMIHYLGRKRFLRRVSMGWSMDWLPVDTTTYFDPSLGSEARLRKELFIFNGFAGIDPVRTPHLDLTLRYGGAFIANSTTFYLKEAYGGDLFSNFQDVCNLEAFTNRCPTHRTLLGNEGVSLRIYPHRNGRFYFGLAYTHFALGRNELMATVGAAF